MYMDNKPDIDYKVNLSNLEESIPVADLDFDEIAKVMQHSEIQMAMPTKGIGRRCFVQIKSQEKEIVVEFFSEALVGDAPTKPEVGYTKSDVETFAGVVFHFPFDKENTKKTCGSIISYDEFLKTYIPEDETVTRIIFDRVMDGMKESSAVNEKFLEQVNEIWGERPSGARALFNNKPH